MAVHKLTLQEFREDFGEAHTDFDIAYSIVQYLDAAGSPALVAVASDYLEAQRVLDAALIAAGLRRD